MAHVFYYTKMDNTQRLTDIPPGDLKLINCIRELLVKEKETSKGISEQCKRNVRETISKMMSQHGQNESIRNNIREALQEMFAQLGINPEKDIYNA